MWCDDFDILHLDLEIAFLISLFSSYMSKHHVDFDLASPLICEYSIYENLLRKSKSYGRTSFTVDFVPEHCKPYNDLDLLY